MAFAVFAACSAHNDTGMGFQTGTTTRSGLGESRLLTSLSQPELQQLCTWAYSLPGVSGGTTHCDGGLTIHNGTAATCMQTFRAPPARCTATVMQAEDCLSVAAVDVCGAFANPACAFVYACATVTVNSDAGAD